MNPLSSTKYHDQLSTDPVICQPSKAVQLALAAFDAAPSSIISLVTICDDRSQVVDFLIQTANAAVGHSLLVTPGQIIGRPLLETFPGNRDSGLFDLYVRVATTGQPERTMQLYADRNGQDAWFAVSAVRQGLDTVVVTFTDITDVRQSELAEKQQAGLFQTVLDHAQAAISLHTAIRNADNEIVDFQTVMANRQAKAMWGEMADPIMIKSFFEVTSPAQQLVDFPRYVRVVETGEPDLAEFNIDDQWWLRTTAKSGDGVVISNIDISENRHYRQQLETANVELKRSNENLQSFAYIASHDLQEPLRKIQAFSDILNERYATALGVEGSEIVGRMQSANERMSSLIRDLLDYSRITSQRDTFRTFSLTKLLDDIAEDLWHPIQQTSAHLVWGDGTGQPLPDLTGDRLQLRQLFQNLLSNALKFYRTDAAGRPVPPTIRVLARRVSGDDLPADLQQDLSINRYYWAIDVADNGIGFDQKHADLIFQVFQRLHSRQHFAGTGIGLAVVKKVAEQHDGAIRVTSNVGVGTTFTVYLPE